MGPGLAIQNVSTPLSETTFKEQLETQADLPKTRVKEKLNS